MRRYPSLSSLRLFMQVAHTSSFSEAARNANVSQPALSRTIRLLEEDLGVRLFDRDTRNVRLTASGAALLPIVERLTADFEHAFTELSETFSGRRGRVVVGALPSLAARILPDALAAFASRAEIEILVKDDLSGPIAQQVLDGQIDIALTTPPDRAENFAFEPFMEDRFMLVHRRGDGLDGSGTIAWSVFGEHPMIAMAPSSSVRALTDQALAISKLKVRPHYQPALLATVGGLIGAGLGISALPQSTMSLLTDPALGWRPLEQPVMSRQLGLLMPLVRSLSPAATALVGHLREKLRTVFNQYSE